MEVKIAPQIESNNTINNAWFTHILIDDPLNDNDGDDFGDFESAPVRPNAVPAENGDAQFLSDDEFGEFTCSPALAPARNNGGKQFSEPADIFSSDVLGYHELNLKSPDLFDLKDSAFRDRTLMGEFIDGSGTVERNPGFWVHEAPAENDDEWGDFVETPATELGQRHGGSGTVGSEGLNGSVSGSEVKGNVDFFDPFSNKGNGDCAGFEPFGNLNLGSLGGFNGKAMSFDLDHSNSSVKNESTPVIIQRDISKRLPLFLFGEDEGLESESDVERNGGVNLFDDSTSFEKKFNGDQTPPMVEGLELNDFIATLYKEAEKSRPPTASDKKEGFLVEPNGEDASRDLGKKDMLFMDANNLFGETTCDSLQLKKDVLGNTDKDESCLSHDDNNVSNITSNGIDLLAYEDEDYDSWEFKDASSEPHSNSQSDGDHVVFHSDQQANSYEGSKDNLEEVTAFYFKLTKYSYSYAVRHLSELEKSLSVASLSNNKEAETIAKDIEMAKEKLEKADGVSEQHKIEELQLRNTAMEELLDYLCHSSLLDFDSTFCLSELIPLAKQNINTAVDLYRHAIWVLLLVSISEEDQCAYLTAWATMISACVTELQHGLNLWNKASNANVHMDILLHPQGKSYFTSLAEIFRVSEILRVSVKLYRPWILLNLDQAKHISPILENCMAAWAESGLKEAVHDKFAKTNGDNLVTLTTWKIAEEIVNIESMKELCPPDAVYSATRENQTVCRLSLLPIKTVHGLKVADWSGQNYFLPVANLWANCVSCKPPKLPVIDFCHQYLAISNVE